jgi:putative transposase
VEKTLNALLDAEADRLCNAQRYERSEARRDTRAGHYERKLQTKAGEVIGGLRTLRGTRVSPSTVSDLNKKIYGTIETWRNRPIEGEHPHVYLDGSSAAGPARSATSRCWWRSGWTAKDIERFLGICEGAKEDKAGWSGFLNGVLPRWRLATLHRSCTNTATSVSHVPSTKMREIAAMLKAIHASEDIVAARQKAIQVIEKLRGLAALATAVEETLAYYAFPEEHWRRIRTNNPLERILR